MGQSLLINLMAQLVCTTLLGFQVYWVLSEASQASRRAAYAFASLIPIVAILFGSPVLAFGINVALSMGLIIVAYRWFAPDSGILQSVNIDRPSLDGALRIQATVLPFGAVLASAAGVFDLPWILLVPTLALPLLCVRSVIAVYATVEAASEFVDDFRSEKENAIEVWKRHFSQAYSKAQLAEEASANQRVLLEETLFKLAGTEAQAEASKGGLERLANSLHNQIEGLERQRDAENFSLTREIGKHWYNDSREQRQLHEARVLEYIKTHHSDRKWVALGTLCRELDVQRGASLGRILGAIDKLVARRYLSTKEIGDGVAWTARFHLKLTQEGVMGELDENSHGPTFNVDGGNVQYIHENQAGAVVQQLNLSSGVKADELKQALAALMDEIETLVQDHRDEPARRELAQLTAELSPEKATDIAKLKNTLEKVTLVSSIMGRAASPVYAAVEFVQKMLGGS